jgi:hypothetical protein
MMAGYSGKTLSLKLGLKPGMVCLLIDPEQAYLDEIADISGQLQIDILPKQEYDFIHAFCLNKVQLNAVLKTYKKVLKKSGMLWISWPKKASGIKTDIDENVVRETGLESGIVDVKVAAIDEKWSGLKFVYRLKDR